MFSRSRRGHPGQGIPLQRFTLAHNSAGDIFRDLNPVAHGIGRLDAFKRVQALYRLHDRIQTCWEHWVAIVCETYVFANLVVIDFDPKGLFDDSRWGFSV